MQQFSVSGGLEHKHRWPDKRFWVIFDNFTVLYTLNNIAN